jgi:hypothetical protein
MPELKTQTKDNNDIFSGIDTVVSAPSTPPLVKASAINEEAEKIRKARELPKKPGDNVTFNELCDWLKILTPEMFPRIMIYVYRLEPVINRQLCDPQSANNIDVISDGYHELSEDYFISRHGGGKYKLVISDLDNNRTYKGGFFNATLNISMLENPPKLDLREVEWENQKNRGYRSWARAQKLVDENNMPLPEKVNATPQSNADAMVQAMKLAMDFANKMDDKQQAQLKKQLGGDEALTKSIGDILLEKMKQDDPNKMVSTLATLLGAMKSMQPPPAANNDTLATIIPMFTSMMQAMQESSKQTFAMLMEIIKSNKSESGGDRDEISRLKDLVEVARELKGGNSNRERSTAEVLTEFAAPIIGPLLNVVGQVMAIRAGGAGAPMPVKGQVVEMPKANETQPGAVGQPQQLPTANPNEATQIIRQFAPIILNKLSGEGWEMGAWIAEGFGEMTAVAVTRYGVEGLLAAAKTVPEFWNQIMTTYGEEHLRKWLTSFVNFKEEMAKMEAEEGDSATS